MWRAEPTESEEERRTKEADVEEGKGTDTREEKMSETTDRGGDGAAGDRAEAAGLEDT